MKVTMTKNNNKMTSKTIILSIIMASLIVPLTLAGTTEADAAMSDIELFEKHSKMLVALYDEEGNHKIALDVLKTEKRTIEDTARISQIDAHISDIEKRLLQIPSEKMAIEDTLDQINKRSIEAHKMDPITESKLLDAEKIILESDIPFRALGLDYSTKTLLVGVADEADKQKVKDLLPDDTPLTLRIDTEPITLRSCDSQTSDCSPLYAGIQIEGDLGKCTVSIPVTQGTTAGFLTAGHCAGVDDVIEQPTRFFGWNKIGDTTQSVFSDGATCDCAFVDQSSGDTFHRSIWLSSSSSYPVPNSAAPTNGQMVWIQGVESGIKVGTITSANIIAPIDVDKNGTIDLYLYNMARMSIVTVDGDSGGPVYGSNTFYGVISSGNANESYLSPWDHIASNLSVS